ncbi:uncharacterized protein LOC143077977 isoform X2 [Mytilus galloprovincialis]|uniref:uncharacterized protein LOC143077977 isoform X2 n=1 Tax=Mytilus galloprovincialis TaxID=29158 RepID=UPI003F7C56B8
MLPNMQDTKNVKRSTMLYRIQAIVYFLMVKYISCEDTNSCKGEMCRKSLAIPLLDNLNAPLFAKLDITQFNKQLQKYITEQIKQGVEQAKNEIGGEMKDLVDTFQDANVNGNFTSKLANGIKQIERHQQKILTDVEQLKLYKESVISAEEEKGNYTSELTNGLKQIESRQTEILTDVDQLKRYKESVISVEEERDNFTSNFKDGLKNMEQQLMVTQKEIQHLKNVQTSLTSQVDSVLQMISANEQTVPKIKERLQNLEGEHKPIRSDISDLESRQYSLSSDISAAVSRLDANEKKVGFTACVNDGDEATKTGGQPIPFTLKRTSYNVDMSSVTSNGKFSVVTSGLYLISATIRSKTDHGYFALYDNAYVLAYGYTAEHNGEDTYVHSGTVDAVRYFVYGDIITVKPWKTMEIGAWSCLTVVKLK